MCAHRSKPIPPLYTVYVLRSTIRRASLYIGSTPHPPRRLKQHNGEAKGGAARTSRNRLRPWEMVGIVSGFPGMVAALKFEWALANPHLSLHIPADSRISKSTAKKRSGRPKRPVPSMTSILSNLHLLLRVPSFAKWPLSLHFFAAEVHQSWQMCCSAADEPIRDTIRVLAGFGRGHKGDKESPERLGAAPAQPWGIHALPLDYAPMKDYVAKARSIFEFEREGACVVCGEDLPPGQGLYAVCSNTGCEGVGHISCWSRHMLGEENSDHVLPITGQCPKCKGDVVWGDMMKELTLRIRGPKEVDRLLKKPRRRKTQAGSDG